MARWFTEFHCWPSLHALIALEREQRRRHFDYHLAKNASARKISFERSEPRVYDAPGLYAPASLCVRIEKGSRAYVERRFRGWLLPWVAIRMLSSFDGTGIASIMALVRRVDACFFNKPPVCVCVCIYSWFGVAKRSFLVLCNEASKVVCFEAR